MKRGRITVLCEYKVADEKRTDFLGMLPEIKQSLEHLGADDISFLEGTDQPGLFVESFQVADTEAYEKIKKTRFEEESTVWARQNECVAGGKNKVHIWAFAKVD